MWDTLRYFTILYECNKKEFGLTQKVSNFNYLKDKNESNKNFSKSLKNQTNTINTTRPRYIYPLDRLKMYQQLQYISLGPFTCNICQEQPR